MKVMEKNYWELCLVVGAIYIGIQFPFSSNSAVPGSIDDPDC